MYPKTAYSSLGFFQWAFWLAIPASAQYNPDIISSAGNDKFTIVCVGSRPPPEIFNRNWFSVPQIWVNRWGPRPRLDKLADICEGYTGAWCAKKTDCKGRQVELMFDEVYSQLEYNRASRQDPSKILMATNEKNHHFSWFDVSRVQALVDYCHTKCFCADQDAAYDPRNKLPCPPLAVPVNKYDFDSDTPLLQQSSRTLFPSGNVGVDWGQNLEDVGFTSVGRQVEELREKTPATASSYGLRIVQARDRNRPRCADVLIPARFQTLLSQRTDIKYKNARELCVHRYAGGNNQTSMGGVCLPVGLTGSRVLSFPYKYRAPILSLDYRLVEGPEALDLLPQLENFCREKCLCPQPEKESVLSIARLKEIVKGQNTAGDGSVDKSSMRPWTLPDGPDGRVTPGSLREKWSGKATWAKQRMCSFESCQGPSCGDECSCQASQIVPGLGWRAQCMTAAALVDGFGSGWRGGVRKRSADGAVDVDELMPCACNATYISRSCCHAGSGLVWESPELKLGSLL